ncbi:hypothetical protein B0T22DRAFT_131444 [Podospora appendiculata]|uniref:Uncharacterized protein n=1 Tax=Podospora appendiculata TaxID=314037 RepID=A0AAE1CBH9_9PEZI|nr:hypothetical protein B0T22DRAFT_131444 [Podospora appendiculata]
MLVLASIPCESNAPPLTMSCRPPGSAIYEITTSKRLFEGIEDEEIETRYARDVLPLFEGVVAGPVVSKCRGEGYKTADEVVPDLDHCFESQGNLLEREKGRRKKRSSRPAGLAPKSNP